jgi:hypothetical protein
MNIREKKISEILSYLESIKHPGSEHLYPIQENIKFFNSITSFKGFFKWIKKEAPFINNDKVCELTELGSSLYDEELHESLIKLERGFVPGFINPLVKKVTSLIKKSNSPLLIADLGSGSAELTRQIIQNVLKKKNLQPLTIVAFDNSEVSQLIAQRNLSCFNESIDFVKKNKIHESDLAVSIKNNNKPIKVIFCSNDIFNIENDFENIQFDIIYHSFFKHHLNKAQKIKLDGIIKKKSEIAFEYDGYHSLSGATIQAFFVWKNPVLLSGAIFSNLRYYSKQELKEFSKDSKVYIYRFGKLLFYRGTYMRIFNK